MKFKRVLWTATSAILHVIVVVVMLQALLSPRGLGLFGKPQRASQYEKITYVEPTRVTAEAPRPAPFVRPPVPETPRSEAQVPPAAAPPATPPATVARGDSGSAAAGAAIPGGAPGPAGGRVLPTLIPGYDPRLAAGAVSPGDTMTGSPAVPGRAGAAKAAELQAGLAARIADHLDSTKNVKKQGDWTVGEGKGKVGIDPQWIYLGVVKIPTTVLALVPMRVQSNPNQREKQRTWDVMAAETRMLGERNAVRVSEIQRIRERVERERARKLVADGKATKVPPRDKSPDER